MASVTRTIIWLLCVAAARAIEVEVGLLWRRDVGLEVQCVWDMLMDQLQSVRLYNNGQQFMIYRPEKHGPSRSEVFRRPDTDLTVNCEVRPRSSQGQCSLVLEPYQPINLDFNYTCEVSGERPTFRIEKKDLFVRAFVPPSDAVMTAAVEQSRVMLNCSTSGLPAPSLNWKVGENKVQADFTERKWNVTSKLWDVWSYLTLVSDDSIAACTPEYNSHAAKAAEYNSAARLLGTSLLKPLVLVALLLSR